MKSFASRVAVLLGVLLSAALGPAVPEASAGGRGSAAAVIVYADGSDFSVMDARGVAVAVDPVEPVGVELVVGDTVVTEHRTFLELELVPSSNIVKIAENTNFTIVERGSPRGGSFAVVYGKVRARVDALTDKEKFTIRGSAVVAGVRGTDFGVTVEVAREEEQAEERAEERAEAGSPAAGSEADRAVEIVQVYCFEGEVEVASAEAPDRVAGAAEAASPEPLVIRADEIVSVEPASGLAQARVRAIPAAVKRYWQEYSFRTEPAAEAAAEARTAAPAPVPASPAPAGAKAAEAEATAERAAELERLLAEAATPPRPHPSRVALAFLGGGGALALLGALDSVFPSVSLTPNGGRELVGLGAVALFVGLIAAVLPAAPEAAPAAP